MKPEAISDIEKKHSALLSINSTLVLMLATSYCMLIGFSGFAQKDNNISGYFKDATDSTAISDVALQIVETGQWAITDEYGYFQIPDLTLESYSLLDQNYKSKNLN